MGVLAYMLSYKRSVSVVLIAHTCGLMCFYANNRNRTPESDMTDNLTLLQVSIGSAQRRQVPGPFWAMAPGSTAGLANNLKTDDPNVTNKDRANVSAAAAPDAKTQELGIKAADAIRIPVDPMGNALTPREYSGRQLTPIQFLFISSATQGKIAYTELKNFKSRNGQAFTLVDSGLLEPCGIALDRKRGFLYVADRSQQKLFGYTLSLETGANGRLHPVTDGTRFVLVTDHPVEWVAVDPSTGAVFFTDQGTNAINKLGPDVVDKLASGIFLAEGLKYKTQDEQEKALEDSDQQAYEQENALEEMEGADTVAKNAESDENSDEPDKEFAARLVEPEQPEVLQTYQAGSDPHVNTPGGVASDGLRLFWVNSASGNTGGTAVEGLVAPGAFKSKAGKAKFPSRVLANNTETAYGLARTDKMVVFSGLQEGRGAVFGTSKHGGPVYTFSSGLGEPRGLAWDGDNTVYVADKAANSVLSMPVGRPGAAPVTPTVVFAGAFGVALLSEDDPAYQDLIAGRSSAGLTKLPILASLLALLVLIFVLH